MSGNRYARYAGQSAQNLYVLAHDAVRRATVLRHSYLHETYLSVAPLPITPEQETACRLIERWKREAYLSLRDSLSRGARAELIDAIENVPPRNWAARIASVIVEGTPIWLDAKGRTLPLDDAGRYVVAATADHACAITVRAKNPTDAGLLVVDADSFPRSRWTGPVIAAGRDSSGKAWKNAAVTGTALAGGYPHDIRLDARNIQGPRDLHIRIVQAPAAAGAEGTPNSDG